METEGGRKRGRRSRGRGVRGSRRRRRRSKRRIKRSKGRRRRRKSRIGGRKRETVAAAAEKSVTTVRRWSLTAIHVGRRMDMKDMMAITWRRSLRVKCAKRATDRQRKKEKQQEKYTHTHTYARERTHIIIIHTSERALSRNMYRL